LRASSIDSLCCTLIAHFHFLFASRSRFAREPTVPICNRLAIQVKVIVAFRRSRWASVSGKSRRSGSVGKINEPPQCRLLPGSIADTRFTTQRFGRLFRDLGILGSGPSVGSWKGVLPKSENRMRAMVRGGTAWVISSNMGFSTCCEPGTSRGPGIWGYWDVDPSIKGVLPKSKGKKNGRGWDIVRLEFADSRTIPRCCGSQTRAPSFGQHALETLGDCRLPA